MSNMLNSLLISFGKTFSATSKLFNLGNGSTWPGHIALSLNKDFIAQMLNDPSIKVICIAGTNGKTTTSKMVTTILKENGKKVLQNTSGANLRNGIASTIIAQSNFVGSIRNHYAIFEVDENTLPLLCKEITPYAVILLNLFRDQLDRYGEIDSIAKKWTNALQSLPSATTVYLNADDPQIAYLGKDLYAKVGYFGLEEKSSNKTLQHAADSIYCPNCHTKLLYKSVYYSHLGNWSCPSCKLKRPKLDRSTSYFPLPGTYNKYNTLAAALFSHEEGIEESIITKALKTITPAFGRQEVIEIDGKKVQLFLAKNPTSFNQTLETVHALGAKHVLFALNDRIPDGRDVSWIWDIDTEEYLDTFQQIMITGDRVYDMALRIEYSQKSQRQNRNVTICEDIEDAINQSLRTLPHHETLFILPTYSAMLAVRKILTGKKIL